MSMTDARPASTSIMKENTQIKRSNINKNIFDSVSSDKQDEINGTGVFEASNDFDEKNNESKSMFQKK